MLLKEQIEKKRTNQVHKWDLSPQDIQKNTDLLVEFLTRIGFSKEKSIEMFFLHDVKGWITGGRKSIHEIEKETIAGMKMDVKIKETKTKKSFKTENENGAPPLFAIHGQRLNPDSAKVQVADWDKGKEIRQFKTLEEATEQQNVWSQGIGTGEFKQVVIEPNKADSGEVTRYTVKAYRTNKMIAELKKNFLNQFKKELETALVVETKNGFHIYWVLRDGLLHRFKAIQEAIVRMFGTDAAVTDIARILRLPYFYHLKDVMDPFFVKVVHWGKQDEKGKWITYDQDELIEFLGLDVSEEHYEKNEIVLPNNEVKRVTTQTPLKLKKSFDITLSKNEMSFVEFVEEIRHHPFSSFFENEEFESTENVFCCHFHEDERPSATLYEMRDGKKAYYCYSSNCDKQHRSVIDVTKSVLSTPKKPISFLQTVKFLAQKSGVKLSLDEFQQEKYQELTFNTQWITNNIECSMKELSAFPMLHEYITRPIKKILKEMILRVLSTPINQTWSYENKPIFFVSYEYLAEEASIPRSLAIKYINLLTLLGLVKKLHHANVPKTLFKRLEQGKQAVNYYCLPLFDDVANEAENTAKALKEMKFKKGEIDFEYIAAAFGLDKAREVFPNDATIHAVQPSSATTKRKMRKKVEDAMSFMEHYAKDTIRKKKYIKEESLLDNTLKEQFDVYSNEIGGTVKRRLFKGELQAIYENFKISFPKEGYKRARLSKNVAKELGLKQSEKQGERIFIWIKNE